MAAYRSAAVPADSRPPEIEIFRSASRTPRVLFAAALGSLLAGAATGALALARHDPTLGAPAATGLCGAVVLAWRGRRSFGQLVVSHVPAERTLRVVLDARSKTDETRAFRATPRVLLEEVRAMRSNPDAPDAPPVFRVRIEGVPRGLTIDHGFSQPAAQQLRKALSEALACWPEP